MLLVVVDFRALDVAPARQGDDHVLVGDEIEDVNAFEVLKDLGLAGGGVAILNFLDLVADDAAQDLVVFQDRAQVFDELDELIVLVDEFLALQVGQALQAHVQDGLGLALGQPKALHQPFPGFDGVFGGPNDGDHFVDVVERDAQAFEDVGALLALSQIEPGAAQDDVAAVGEEVLQDLLDIEQRRPVVGHDQHVDAERGFQRRVLVQGVDDNVGDDALFEVQDDADALAVGLVAQVGHALNAAVVNKRRYLFDQGRLVERIRDFPDDHGNIVFLAFLDLGPAPDFDGAASGGVGFGQALAAVDGRAGGEVRPLDQADDVGDRAGGRIEQVQQAVAQLAQVVGRDVGGHADGDARGAV